MSARPGSIRCAAARVGVATALSIAAGSGALAHVGSPDVFLEETAGPYELILIVHMPPAIPGDAEMQVRIQNGRPEEDLKVEVREVPPQGEAFAAGWTAIEPSEVDRDFYSTPVSLMIFGLWHAEVRITGPRGDGTVAIPLPARRPQPQAIEPWFASLLVGLGSLFFIALWQILAGFGRDGARPRDEAPARADVIRGRLVGAGGVAFFAFILTFISMHWIVIYGQHKRLGVPPLESEVSVAGGPLRAGQVAKMALVIRNRRGEPFEDVVREHGKDMHLVALKLPGLDWFLHAHPRMVEPGRFEFDFEPPDPGEYVLFSDVVHTTGLVETVTNTVSVNPGAGPAGGAADGPTPDPDDSVASPPPLAETGTRGDEFDVGDGLRMRWLREGGGLIRPGEFRRLAFEVVDASGRPVTGLEPYLGVEGHLMVLRDDASVYAHVRPRGTLVGRGGAPDPGSDRAARIGFPYGFPESGLYRLFVQMKVDGTVRTGVFDVRVG